MTKQRRSSLLNAIEKIALIALGCLLAELALRMFHYRPWSQLIREELGTVVTEADPYFGWSLRPGNYTFRNGSSVTIWDTKERASAAATSNAPRSVVLLGDSNIFGYAISDNETLSWALQETRPDLRIRNFAAPGYSFLQEMLVAERMINSSSEKPDFLIAALLDFEGYRSIAHPQWAELIAERSPFLNAVIPYAELSPGHELVLHPPRLFWPNLPLREYSATVRLIEQAYEHAKARRRMKDGPEIVRRLITKLQTALNARQVPWVLFSFSPGAVQKFGYDPFLQQQQIPFLECIHPHFNEPGFRAIDDDHPNAKVHQYWAKCLQQHLDRELPEDLFFEMEKRQS